MVGRDDGEFELILGNKQLLSVLFIVIVLLGVFFAMGFLAGRSTGPGAAEVAHKDTDQVPISVDAATKKSAEPPSAPPVVQPAPVETPVEPETKTPAPAPAESAKAEPAKAAPVETKAPPAKPAEAPKAAAPAAAGFTQAPPAGTYLQVAAVRRAEAENMLSYIVDKTKLHGYVTPVPKSSEIFRVVIGPLKGNEDLAAARTKLSDIGIKTPYPVKY